ncbi:YkgJ family cysteine cluster protein [Trichloromonas acetexigens]|uniref:YkgJ family cysteine cluster protein n=1 Tax=Trichloromonas acetexigens TaxID=38815 RepID=A0A550JK77_9BACT|nr:YkgJ family cysteine cluster protein [Desulfuromonas acetexigens]TRO83616.1 YkgJ family cysteine cluster protein [Desulfuromonas acetexigens]
MERLSNYRQLVARVDELCARIEGDFREGIFCRRGCDSCCRHLSLFPVEAAALTAALAEAPEGLATEIRERAREAAEDGPCPLLKDGACLLYAARPLICRTHGLPLLGRRDGERFIDYCPLNFQGMESLPASAVIDLETLNATLAAVNRLFVKESGGDEGRAEERITIARALRSDV